VRRRIVLVSLALTAACGHGGNKDKGALAPTPVQQPATAEQIDSVWNQAILAFRHGKWGNASKLFDQVGAELPPGDPRISQTQFYLGEVQYARGENLEAVRHFRRVSDETPNDPLAPDALGRVGDAYADLWKRPELDPTYGQTALATYQELVNRYPGTPAAQRAQTRIQELNDNFAVKQYKAALYYIRYKAYDSARLYLRDLAATYPKAAITPVALIKLVEINQKLGYKEDVQETCGYLLRFHPKAEGVREACPAQSAPTT
jgi:outer membrane protein assembly factor BamD